MNRTVCLRTSISTLLQSNPGSFCRPTCLPSLSTTEHPRGGPRKALNAEPLYWHGHNSSSPNAPNASEPNTSLSKRKADLPFLIFRWEDGSVHQNLTFPVEPDCISGR